MTDTELTLEKLANMLASGLPNLDEAGFIKLVAAARNHIGAAAEELRVADTSSTRIDVLVERFLAWPLPASVCCDLCVTKRMYQFTRSGTNLLTAYEARGMIEYLLDGLPAASEPPANREDAGGVARDQPGDVNKLIEQEAFNRGLEVAADCIKDKHTNNVGMVHPMVMSDVEAIRALKNTGGTGMPQQELPQASYDYQSSARIGAGAPCPDCGTSYGWKHEDGCSVMARNLANIQRLGQEFDDDGLKAQARPLSETLSVGDVIQREIDKSKVSASDLSETESVGAEVDSSYYVVDDRETILRRAGLLPAPSQQGDDAVEQRLRGLIDRWHNGSVDGNEVLATLHCSATALKTLKAERDKAVANTNKTLCAKSETDREIGRMTAERDSLSKKVERLTALLREANPFVGYSMHVPDIKAKIDAALAEEDA